MLLALSGANLNHELAAGFLRVAYATGYQDALCEPFRGQLLRDHGYRVPPRRSLRGGE